LLNKAGKVFNIGEYKHYSEKHIRCYSIIKPMAAQLFPIFSTSLIAQHLYT
jgi:hypothetical protein